MGRKVKVSYDHRPLKGWENYSLLDGKTFWEAEWNDSRDEVNIVASWRDINLEFVDTVLVENFLDRLQIDDAREFLEWVKECPWLKMLVVLVPVLDNIQDFSWGELQDRMICRHDGWPECDGTKTLWRVKDIEKFLVESGFTAQRWDDFPSLKPLESEVCLKCVRKK